MSNASSLILGTGKESRFHTYLAMVSHNDRIIPLTRMTDTNGKTIERGVWFLCRGVRIVERYARYSDVLIRYWTVEVNDNDDGMGGSGSWETHPTNTNLDFTGALAIATELIVNQSTTKEQR